MVARHARRIHAERALAFQAAIAPYRNLRMLGIAQGFATILLMLFEVYAVTFHLRVLSIAERTAHR